MKVSPTVKSGSQLMQHRLPADQPYFYLIRIEGVLDPKWTAWFEDLSLTIEGEDTLLSGWMIDQSALYGLLTRISDLGLLLISVERLPDNLDAKKEVNS